MSSANTFDDKKKIESQIVKLLERGSRSTAQEKAAKWKV